MSPHHQTRSNRPLITVLGKIGNWYQAYCTSYKTHAMATHHGGTGHPLNRGLVVLIEDAELTNINNHSTHNSDATAVLGRPEVVGHPEYTVYI